MAWGDICSHFPSFPPVQPCFAPSVFLFLCFFPSLLARCCARPQGPGCALMPETQLCPHEASGGRQRRSEITTLGAKGF